MIAGPAVGQANPVQFTQVQCVIENAASADRLPCASGGSRKMDPNFVVAREIF